MASFLLINQYYWPDEAATAQLLRDLAEDLVRNGHEVTVLCGRGRYSCAEAVGSGGFEHNGVRIERVGGTDLRWRGGVWRALDILTFLVGARWRVGRISRHDAVIAMTSPPLAGWLGAIFSRRHGVPLALWVQDVYPEIAERTGALRNPLLRHWARWLARRIYGLSRRIIVPGQDMRETLRVYPEVVGKVCAIPNWADDREIQSAPLAQNRVRREQGWNGRHVLMYSGNLGVAHDLDTMLELVFLMERGLSSMWFVLVGDSPRHEAFAERCRKRGIQRMTRLPFQSRRDLGETLGAADAHLVSQRTEAEGLVVPSKFYGAVAAGRPVVFVGSANSEIGRNVVVGRLGAVVAPGAAAAGLDSALKTLRMIQDGGEAVSTIRRWAETHASRQARTGEFQRALEELVKC